jgi:hypothetical protein
MGTARYSFGACVLDGELYVTGGKSDDRTSLSSVEKYSPLTDTWSAVAPLPAARLFHAAVTVGRDMYVLGGIADTLTASVLKFDSTLGAWIQVAPMPAARFAMASCAFASDIYVFGGAGGDDSGTSVFKFETTANQWSTLNPMPMRSECSSATILEGLIYIVGADNTGKGVMSFNPTLDAWTRLAPTLNSRWGGASFVLQGCLHAAGGIFGDSSLSVERYDVASNIWTAVADMHERRVYFAVITIGSAGRAEEQNLFDSLIAKATAGGP